MCFEWQCTKTIVYQLILMTAYVFSYNYTKWPFFLSHLPQLYKHFNKLSKEDRHIVMCAFTTFPHSHTQKKLSNVVIHWMSLYHIWDWICVTAIATNAVVKIQTVSIPKCVTSKSVYNFLFFTTLHPNELTCLLACGLFAKFPGHFSNTNINLCTKPIGDEEKKIHN